MDDLSKLISRSTAGDRNALDELFEMAKKAEEGGRHAESSRLFREAAISFRISAFRERAHREHAENTAKSVAAELKLITRILDLTGFVQNLDRSAMTIDQELVRKLVVEDIRFDESTAGIFPLLARRLAERGMHFSSPGGSIQRKLTVFLWSVYSDFTRNAEREIWLQDSVVRLAVHYIMSIIESRIKNS